MSNCFNSFIKLNTVHKKIMCAVKKFLCRKYSAKTEQNLQFAKLLHKQKRQLKPSSI